MSYLSHKGFPSFPINGLSEDSLFVEDWEAYYFSWTTQYSAVEFYEVVVMLLFPIVIFIFFLCAIYDEFFFGKKTCIDKEFM